MRASRQRDLTGSRFCEELSAGDEMTTSFDGVDGVDYETEVGAAWREMRERGRGEKDGIDGCGSIVLIVVAFCF